MGCRGNQLFFIHRHNEVLQDLRQSLGELSRGDLPALSVDPEPVFFNMPSRTSADAPPSIVPPNTSAHISSTIIPSRKRADMYIRMSNPQPNQQPSILQDFIFDIAICSPVCSSYRPIQETFNDISDYTRSNNFVERIKYSKYRDSICDRDAYFRPLVFNAAGGPGLDFYGVMADHLNLPFSVIKRILGRIATIIARYNAKMIVKYYSHLHKNDGNLPHTSNLCPIPSHSYVNQLDNSIVTHIRGHNSVVG